LSDKKDALEYSYQRDGYLQKICLSIPLKIVSQAGPVPEGSLSFQIKNDKAPSRAPSLPDAVVLNMDIVLNGTLEESKPKIEVRLVPAEAIWQGRLQLLRPKAFGAEEMITDYIEGAEAQISKMVQAFYDSVRRRKHFIDSVIKDYRLHILECDIATHTSVSLLFEGGKAGTVAAKSLWLNSFLGVFFHSAHRPLSIFPPQSTCPCTFRKRSRTFLLAIL